MIRVGPIEFLISVNKYIDAKINNFRYYLLGILRDLNTISIDTSRSKIFYFRISIIDNISSYSNKIIFSILSYGQRIEQKSQIIGRLGPDGYSDFFDY